MRTELKHDERSKTIRESTLELVVSGPGASRFTWAAFAAAMRCQLPVDDVDPAALVPVTDCVLAPPTPPPLRRKSVPVTRPWGSSPYSVSSDLGASGPQRPLAKVPHPRFALLVRLRGTAAATKTIAAFVGLLCGSDKEPCDGSYHADTFAGSNTVRSFVVDGVPVKIWALRAEIVSKEAGISDKVGPPVPPSAPASTSSPTWVDRPPFPLVAALEFIEARTFPSPLNVFPTSGPWEAPRRASSWLAELYMGFELQCATDEAHRGTGKPVAQLLSQQGRARSIVHRDTAFTRKLEESKGGRSSDDDVDFVDDEHKAHSTADSSPWQPCDEGSIGSLLAWQFERRAQYRRDLMQGSWPGCPDVSDMNLARRRRQTGEHDKDDSCRGFPQLKGSPSSRQPAGGLHREDFRLSFLGAVRLWRWLQGSGSRCRSGRRFISSDACDEKLSSAHLNGLSVPELVRLVQFDSPAVFLSPRLSWACEDPSGDALHGDRATTAAAEQEAARTRDWQWPTSGGYSWGPDAPTSPSSSRDRDGDLGSVLRRWERLAARQLDAILPLLSFASVVALSIRLSLLNDLTNECRQPTSRVGVVTTPDGLGSAWRQHVAIHSGSHGAHSTTDGSHAASVWGIDDVHLIPWRIAAKPAHPSSNLQDVEVPAVPPVGVRMEVPAADNPGKGPTPGRPKEALASSGAGRMQLFDNSTVASSERVIVRVRTSSGMYRLSLPGAGASLGNLERAIREDSRILPASGGPPLSLVLSLDPLGRQLIKTDDKRATLEHLGVSHGCVIFLSCTARED